MGRRTKVCGCIAGVLVLACGIWMFTRPTSLDRLDDLMAELRARGEPVSLAEMEPPMPPAEANGATDLDAMPQFWTLAEVGDDWTSNVAGPWNDTIVAPWEENATDAELEAVRTLVASLEAFFVYIDAAADKREIVWALDPSDLEDPMDGGSSDMRRIRELHNLLVARAVVAATPAERLRAIESCLALGARTRARRLNHHMSYAGVFADGCRSLRTALEHARVDPIDARRELDDLLSTRWDSRLARMARGERAFIIERFPHWLDGSLTSELWGSPLDRSTRILGEIAMNLGARPPRNLMSLPGGAIDDLRHMDRYLDPETSAADICASSVPWRQLDPIARIFVFALQRLVGTDANAGLARTALAAYAFRDGTGDWPTSATDLVPLVPAYAVIDSFTEEPFVLERDGDVLVIRAQPWSSVADSEEERVFDGYVWRLPPR